jgi:hypothetical protein
MGILALPRDNSSKILDLYTGINPLEAPLPFLKKTAEMSN